jgi:hypothetical protein
MEPVRVNRKTFSQEIPDREEKASDFIGYAIIFALAGSQNPCDAHKHYVTLFREDLNRIKFRQAHDAVCEGDSKTIRAG